MFAEVVAGNWLSQAAAWWLPILLDATIKGTVVLGVAGMMVLFMRRASAAARHMVWTLGLVSLMLLPVLSAALPAWQVLPSWLSWNQPAAQADAGTSSPPETSLPARWAAAARPGQAGDRIGGEFPAVPTIAETPATDTALVTEAAPPAETALAQTAASVSSNAASPHVAAAAMFIWLAGAAWALLPAAIACLSLWRLGRRSPRIHGGPWRATVDRLSAELGLRRRVAILCSPNRRMPMVWGTVRPKLLIPADACAWSAQRLRAVLLHELAHVRRHDCLVHWVAQLARAIHWSNPLAWIASRRAAMESERACDDAVLTHGFTAPDYAQHLLEIAGGYRVRQWEASAAIAMARSSRLETRFLAILDGGRNRRRVTLRRALLAVAIGVAATALLAIIQPGKDVNTQAFAGAPGQALKPAADAKAPAKSAKKLAAPPTAAEQAWVEFRGRVVDAETGFPIEQFALQWNWRDPRDPSRIAWGSIISTISSTGPSEGRFSEQTQCQAGEKVGLRILADGYLPQPVTTDLVVAPSTNINLIVRMRRGGEVRGRVLDYAGKPVGDATVYLAGSQMLNLMDGKAEHFSGSTATTDTQGRFSLSGVGGAEGRLVIASAPLAVWTAAVPEAGKEATIKLPEPALLKVRSEISGAGGQVRLHLELKTWEMEGWKGFVGARKHLDAPNPGDATFAGLTPGTYDFWRVKELSVGDFGKGMFLDRRTITLESGKTTLAEFVRKGGHPIVGQLTGLKDTGVAGAFIFVKDGQATGDPRRMMDEYKVTTFDADVCAVDGQFKTETVPPGQYTVVAEAYKPDDSGRLGLRLPNFLGTAKVTVGEGGPPPRVRIEMKPYGSADAGKVGQEATLQLGKRAQATARGESGDPKGRVKKDAEPAKTAKKPEPRAPAELATVEFRGRVVDAETGFPIEQFTLQWGWPDPTDPKRIAWGGSSLSSSRFRNGEFSTNSAWQKGRKGGLRVLADGYLPQPVVPDVLVEAPATWVNLVVRLKRGGEIAGRVLDHAGKPVPDAVVYLAGNMMLNLVDGTTDDKSGRFSGSTAVTDAQGRFALSGVGGEKNRLVITSAPLAVWTAPVPEAGKEATITLPQPAGIKIRFDVPGGGDEGRFHLHLKTWEMEGWKQAVDARRYLNVPNSGEKALTNLTPGTYDLARTKQLRVGNRGQGAFLDRRNVTLEAGKTTEIQLVRKTGQPIAGQLMGLKDTGVAGAFVFVKDGKATGDPRGLMADSKLATFDALACAVDGQFKTETLPPGEYTVIAEAYKPDNSGRRGERLPDYFGTAKVTVGEGGPPPQVRIEMKPYRFTP